MSGQDEIALLRAQLIQCTTAMREAGAKLGDWLGMEGIPDNALIADADAILYKARGSAVTHDQIDQFRAGEWQRARQEADQLRVELGKSREQLYDAKESEREVSDRLAEVKSQLELTQKALVEERAKNDFPNPPLTEARAKIAELAQKLAQQQARANDWQKSFDEAKITQRIAEERTKRLLTERTELKEQLNAKAQRATDAENALAEWKETANAAREQIAKVEEDRRTSMRAAEERTEQWRKKSENYAQAFEFAQAKLFQASKLAALLESIVGESE